MLRSNIRSFRFSDRVSEILMGSQGCNMNDKFENLVLYCHDTIPRVKKELKSIEREISSKRQEYSRLCEDLREVSSLIQSLKELKRVGDIAVKKAEKICNSDFDIS